MAQDTSEGNHQGLRAQRRRTYAMNRIPHPSRKMRQEIQNYFKGGRQQGPLCITLSGWGPDIWFR